ncbi:MAG TPA: flagellar hook-basal body complex protein FliE [Terriglobales bacterium]|nr:flagellar hook-basal body complex protein FliE [Terriglobales bacterium]
MSSPISPIRIVPAEIAPPAAPSTARAGGGDSFLSTLQQSMDAIEGAQGDAQTQVAQLLSGKGADLHSAMIAVEKADLSFQLMMQVRNKIVQAYQQISNMQF